MGASFSSNISFLREVEVDLVSYKYVQHGITSDKILIINTMIDSKQEQSCLISSTIHAEDELDIIDGIISNTDSFGRTMDSITVIVYGKNSSDIETYTKYKQLLDYGFDHVKIYTGGMFEWMLLQDIYGVDLFPTTSQELDILKFEP
jgi:hypothetical protein